MRHALTLGGRGLGRVWPWPSVGCVIVKDGRIIGRGVTDRADTYRHAEIVALAQAGDAARGATAYVTLEPCAHVGTTPPCAKALIKAGIKRVVAAVTDPNPKVAGAGFQMLRDAGVNVETGLLADQATAQMAGFLSTMTQGRPRLTLKLAITLDGRIATAMGESRWITGAYSRRMVHGMRLAHDAVLIGGGTARADDPTLTVRDMGDLRQPVRVVASRRLTLPWPNRLGDTLDQGPVWLVHGAGDVDADVTKNWTDAGAELIEAPVTAGQLEPQGILSALGARGLTSVFCEGGGAFAASLLNAGLVDELVVFSAGRVLGAQGIPAIGALEVDRLIAAPAFKLVETRAIGADVMHVWRNSAEP